MTHSGHWRSRFEMRISFVRRRTRRPARLLVLHPPHRTRQHAVVVALGECARAVLQRRVTGRVLGALRHEALHEIVDETRAFASFDARRYQHHDPTPRPVRRPRLLSPGRGPNLYLGSIEARWLDRDRGVRFLVGVFAHQTMMFTSRGGRETIRFGVAPARTALIAASSSASVAASAIEMSGGTSIRARTLPLTCTTIVTLARFTSSGSASGHDCTCTLFSPG